MERPSFFEPFTDTIPPVRAAAGNGTSTGPVPARAPFTFAPGALPEAVVKMR